MLAAAAVVALAVGSAPAAGERLDLTGNDLALWLVRTNDDGSFDVVALPTGETWQWIARQLPAPPPLALAASGRNLHMLFEGGQYYNLALDKTQNKGASAYGHDWPDKPPGTLLLEAINFARDSGVSLVALVARPADDGPARAPVPATASAPTTRHAAAATRPAATQPVFGPEAQDRMAPLLRRFRLGVFQYLRDGWAHLTDLQYALPAYRLGGALATIDGQDLYVYVPGQYALWRWRQGPADRWQLGLELSDEMIRRLDDGGSALMLTTIRRKLTMVLAVRGEGADKDRRELAVASYEGGRWHLAPVALEGKPLTWPADGLPLTAPFGNDVAQVALLWREGEALKLASADASGRVTPRDDVTVFTKPPPSAQGQQVLEYFLWGVLAAVIVPMFLLRQKAPRGPFVIPPRRRPGNLLKRLGAALIDLLPWTFIASALFQPAMPPARPETLSEFLALMEQYGGTAEAAYVVVASSLMFVAYCIVMEMRLGATVGKLILKLRVVNDEGDRPNVREAVLRNLLKIIEMSWPPLVPLMLIIPAMTRARQRLGDIVARTAVIDATWLGPPPLEPEGTGRGPFGGPEPGEPPQERDDGRLRPPEYGPTEGDGSAEPPEGAEPGGKDDHPDGPRA